MADVILTSKPCVIYISLLSLCCKHCMAPSVQARRIIELAAPADVWQDISSPCAAARPDLRPVALPALNVRRSACTHMP